MIRCGRCGRPGAVVRGSDREATVATVAGRVERRPVVACPDGHGHPVDLTATAQAACHDLLPHARRRRLRRTDDCGRCGAPLTMPVRRTERAVTVVSDDAPVTTLRFDLPTTRCTDCGADQVPARSQADLAAVVAALFAPDGADGDRDTGRPD